MENNFKPLRPYFVEIDLPEIKNEHFMDKIPAHRKLVQEWIIKGVIRSYNVSMAKDKVWLVMYGEGYTSVADAVASLPLAEYFTTRITELLFTENNTHHLPELSMN